MNVITPSLALFWYCGSCILCKFIVNYKIPQYAKEVKFRIIPGIKIDKGMALLSLYAGGCCNAPISASELFRLPLFTQGTIFLFKGYMVFCRCRLYGLGFKPDYSTKFGIRQGKGEAATNQLLFHRNRFPGQMRKDGSNG
jgi:hypothetical protein